MIFSVLDILGVYFSILMISRKKIVYGPRPHSPEQLSLNKMESLINDRKYKTILSALNELSHYIPNFCWIVSPIVRIMINENILATD